MSTLWYEFLDEVRRAKHELGNPKNIWYRGHSNSMWALVPSLHRLPNGTAQEHNAFHEFERSAARLFKRRDNEWQTLFDMQHYGLPTRLLDWTEALGVATAFAILDSASSSVDAAIFVLDPTALNKASGITGIREIPSDAFEYKKVYWDHVPFAATYPIAIDPTFQNNRMIAQRGTFTVHGTVASGLETQCPNVVRKVVLPAATRGEAAGFLEDANLNAYSIYPDIVGMARHLRKKCFDL